MAGVAQVRQVLTAFVDQAYPGQSGFYTGLLAQLEAETLGRGQRAGSRRRSVPPFATKSNIVARFPSCIDLRGEILLKRNPPDTALAEEAFVASLPSRRSKARVAQFFWRRLRSPSSTNRPVVPPKAHAVLAPALEGFSPTPEMPEIAEAQALLVAIEAAAHLTHE